MPHIIVEYKFDSPPTDADFDAASAKLHPCLEARSVTWVQSFVALDRMRRICVFEAADAEIVREAYRSAKVGFERAWAADEIADED